MSGFLRIPCRVRMPGERLRRSLLFPLILFCGFSLSAEDDPESEEFLSFIKARATSLRKGESLPSTLAEWSERRQTLRHRLAQSWGPFPETRCSLNPKKLGVLEFDGYRIEKIIFQTLPDIWMTANAYVPDGDQKRPAVLSVHGHWPGAKQDPVVQARCVGLARLGFFVLSVDAFGAGERGINKALGEYHGEMVAATLIPIGSLLAGLQVYENMRALDYIQSRREVDPRRIGVTGASGGGNQSMYIGAWDERLKSVVPTCSVGNYQAYLGAACCLCEVVPGALTYSEEWSILGLVSPRSLLVINATLDAIQFSVGEARKSLDRAMSVFRAHGKPESIKHAVFESGHDYSQPMREAMYGWMTTHLKLEGSGDPVPEPEVHTVDRELLRCYPNDTRPAGWTTLPQFAASEGRKLVAQIGMPATVEQMRNWSSKRRMRLQEEVFAQEYRAATSGVKPSVSDGGSLLFDFASEPGITIHARVEKGTSKRTAVLLDLAGIEKAATSDMATDLRDSNWTIVSIALRATGRAAPRGDGIRRAPDHNSAEWALWTGRTLLEQWVWDTRRVLDVVAHHDPSLTESVAVFGTGPAGVVAIVTAALDHRIDRVVTLGSLTSYVSDVPYEGQRLGIMVPGILRDVGDIPHLAALVAPRPLLIAGGVTGGGQLLDEDALARAYRFTRRAYELEQAGNRFAVSLNHEGHEKKK